MKIFREAREGKFDWMKQPAWASLDVEEDLNESTVLTEDKYTDIEVGTCFKLAAKPAVYEIIKIENDEAGTVIFQSYKHPTGNLWKTTYNYLNHLVEQGEFEILSAEDLEKLMEY